MKQRFQKQKSRFLKKMVGQIFISSTGVGYVKPTKPETSEEVEVETKNLNTALHGDLVEISLSSRSKHKKTGKVLKVLSRSKRGYAGVLKQERGIFFLNSPDRKMYTNILIPENALNGAMVGMKIFVELVTWKDPQKTPEGRVIKILGWPGENNAEMEAIVLEKGFRTDFPAKVMAEAEKIEREGLKEENYQDRRNFKNTPTFTIDPETAKDFDDAISFRSLKKNEYEIGIHIADVTNYVKIGSALDREARRRGTSVYLVDRTIPMLPEALANNLCSLMPNTDRLAVSTVFIMDKKARILKEWFGRTIIRSQKRFTYEEAEISIKNPDRPFHRELATLNDLAKILATKRLTTGAISFDQEEVNFILDKNGVPIKIEKKERGWSSKLIEEFMLLANKKVAETISQNIPDGEKIFVYRVHDLPEREKMEELAGFLRGLGHKVTLKDGLIPKREINLLLEKLSGTTDKDAIHRVIIRSMAKAIYSTKNIGHYGLSFKHYTHFTSPIRRYPDIMVHRFLLDFLNKKKIDKSQIHLFEEMSRQASEQERRAMEAERASIKYKQAEYMHSRIGKVFNGIISGITEWGIYVEEKETKCEGLVRIRDLGDDFYIFNEKKLEIFGQRSKKKYRLGNIVTIKVKAVDLARKTIDYVLER